MLTLVLIVRSSTESVTTRPWATRNADEPSPGIWTYAAAFVPTIFPYGIKCEGFR
jgi:hypothetical protein